jgi:hypothetical protein
MHLFAPARRPEVHGDWLALKLAIMDRQQHEVFISIVGQRANRDFSASASDAAG